MERSDKFYFIFYNKKRKIECRHCWRLLLATHSLFCITKKVIYGNALSQQTYMWVCVFVSVFVFNSFLNITKQIPIKIAFKYISRFGWSIRTNKHVGFEQCTYLITKNIVDFIHNTCREQLESTVNNTLIIIKKGVIRERIILSS